MKKQRLVSLPSLKEAAKRNPSESINYLITKIAPSAFLLSWGQGKSFCIRTYGCQANVRDSETIRSYLLAIGMHEQDSFDNADFILFNTCAVRENAEDKVYGEIGNLKKYRKINKKLVLGPFVIVL